MLEEAFATFRDDIDVLSLDTVSEEVLADADFLFDLAEADFSLPSFPYEEPAPDAATPMAMCVLSALASMTLAILNAQCIQWLLTGHCTFTKPSVSTAFCTGLPCDGDDTCLHCMAQLACSMSEEECREWSGS